MTVPARLVDALADRYAFERELGQGGMATVYLADDLRHQRKVAIKVLRPDLAATIGSDRFFREIRIAAQLQHPHILPLLESGEAAGYLFYVMPYVEGQSLRDRLAKSGELPVHEAVRLLVEIVDALSYAHARGVVHRDVKPDNVMLSGRHALVMDFGVAKAVSEASGRNQLTTAGVALGTPAYMAPEQAAADPNLDHRVDIYAVGAMGYELITGRPPFVGGTPQQVLAAHVTQPPEPVSRYRPGVSPALEAVIMRCLAKRPADRFQTADELHAQLEPLVTPSGGMTPTSTRPVEGWKPERRGRGAWIAAAVVLAAIAVAGWALGSKRGSRAAVQPDRAQLTFTGNAAAASLSPDGRRLAYARRECDSAGYCTQSLVVEDVGGAGSATIASGALAIWNTRWSADARHLVVGAYFPEGWGNYSIPTLGGGRTRLRPGNARLVGNGDTTLVLWKLPTDTVAWVWRIGTASGIVYDSVALASPLGEFPQLDVTDGGQWLIVYAEPDARIAQRGTLTIADRSGRVRDSLVFPHDRVTGVVAVPGTNALVAASRREGTTGWDAIVYRYDRSGRLRERADTVLRDVDAGNADVGPNGELVLLAGTREYSIWSFRWDDHDRVDLALRRLASSTNLQVTGSVSPDGERIFLARRLIRDGRVVTQPSVIPADSGPERLLGAPRLLEDWDWSQREIVVAERQGDSLVVGTLDPDNGRFRRLRAFDPDSLSTLEALPGSGIVYFSIIHDRIYRALAPGRPDTSFALPEGMSFVNALEPSPDGREVAVAGFGDLESDSLIVSIVSLDDGSTRRVAGIVGDHLDNPRWLPDGTLIVPVFETEWTLALYRAPAGGGPLVRLGPVPRFPGSYRFSADGRRGIIRATDETSDVHVLRNFRDIVEAR
ncbi:MAG TPA: serine/threonine-protein kinase [Gemmatimonadales bacterium]